MHSFDVVQTGTSGRNQLTTHICMNIQGEHMSLSGQHQYSTEMDSKEFLKQIRMKTSVSMYLTFWLSHPDVQVCEMTLSI